MERKYFAYAKKIEEDFLKFNFWKNSQLTFVSKRQPKIDPLRQPNFDPLQEKLYPEGRSPKRRT